MGFAIPTEWTAQTGYQVRRYVRATDLRDLIENDRFICATRRPGYAGAWPTQSVTASGQDVATLDVYRPPNGDTLVLRVWGDACKVFVTDGSTTASAVCADTGAPTLATATLTGVASGWVSVTITADPAGATPVLTGWQLADGNLAEADLPA